MKKEYKSPKMVIMGKMMKITQGGSAGGSNQDANNSGFDAANNNPNKT